jgi:tetratricopeptide (TPR) repeat protein
MDDFESGPEFKKRIEESNKYRAVLWQGIELLYTEKNYADAAACFTSVIEFYSAHTLAYGLRADSYAAMGEDEKAIADYKNALSLPPLNKVYLSGFKGNLPKRYWPYAQKTVYTLADVPENLRTPELCRIALELDSGAFRYVPDAQKTPEMCLDAAGKSWRALQHVPENLRTLEVCLAAVKLSEFALKDVPKNLKARVKKAAGIE